MRNIGMRLKSYLKAYVIYGSVLVFLHNILYRMGLFTPGYIGYDFQDFVTGFFNTFVFLYKEPFFCGHVVYTSFVCQFGYFQFYFCYYSRYIKN